MESTISTFATQIRSALTKVSHDLGQLTISINNLNNILTQAESDEPPKKFDAKDPSNKIGTKLTDRGIEVCYRLFDQGDNPNMVANKMDISWSAAKHRYYSWLHSGGLNRDKTPLE